MRAPERPPRTTFGNAAWTEKRIQDRDAIIKKELKEPQTDVLLTKFYNFSPLENLKSILEKGILCHRLLEEENIPHKDITNHSVMIRRKEKFIKDNKSLHDFTNLYFNARNAMMYAVTRDKDRGNICSEFAVIEIEIDIRKSYCEIPVYISDINAANDASTFYDAQRLSLGTYKKIKELATSTYDVWNKAATQAECLIENKTPTNYFKRIHVCCDEMVDKVRTLTQSKLPIYKNPDMFFM